MGRRKETKAKITYNTILALLQMLLGLAIGFSLVACGIYLTYKFLGGLL